MPVVLLHGWPSGPIEYEAAARLLLAAGREVIVPSLPGFAWSEAPAEPLNVAGMSARLRELLERGPGARPLRRSPAATGAGSSPRASPSTRPSRVAALYVSTPGVLPTPADLADPPLSEDEVAYAERAQRWLRREGHHMLIQSVGARRDLAGAERLPGGAGAPICSRSTGAGRDSGGDSSAASRRTSSATS